MTNLQIVSAESTQHNTSAISELKKLVLEGKTVSIYEAADVLELSSLTLTDKKELAKTLDIDIKEINARFKELQLSKPIINELGRKPKTEYDYVDLQLDKWNTTMTYQCLFTIDTPYVFGDQILDRRAFEQEDDGTQAIVAAADAKTFPQHIMQKKLIKASKLLGLGFREREIELALEDWVERKKAELKSMMVADIVYTEYDQTVINDEWNKLVNIITDVNKPHTRVILEHFIWQVKRKLFGKKVTDHMMPVLLGNQGIGKSTLIQMISAPVKDFTASTDFKAITDARSITLWDNLILIFDEMGNSTNANIEDIKRRITEDTFSQRIMHTNINSMIVNNATFFGSTNRDLSRLIVDDTGMRRFYQIDCKDKFDWEVMSTVSFDLLWKSVNEHKPSKLKDDLKLFEEIREIQNSKRHIPLVEQFLLQLKKGDYKITALQLYKDFAAFELQHTPKNEMNSTRFGKELMDIYKRIPGLEITKGRNSTGNIYNITYN